MHKEPFFEVDDIVYAVVSKGDIRMVAIQEVLDDDTYLTFDG